MPEQRKSWIINQSFRSFRKNMILSMKFLKQAAKTISGIYMQKLLKLKPDIVIAAGGDGTINMVATELLGSKIKLGIIPNGSANGLAYNLTIPNAFEEALRNKLKRQL